MASASTSSYCATFDPNPSAPSPLRAEECTKNPASEHQSQLFAFNRHTGVVRPMWFNSQIDGAGSEKGDCSVDAPPTPQNASMAGATEVDTKNVTSTPSTTPATTGNSTVLPADTPQAAPSNSSGSTVSGVQKVAMVFVPADPEVLLVLSLRLLRPCWRLLLARALCQPRPSPLLHLTLRSLRQPQMELLALFLRLQPRPLDRIRLLRKCWECKLFLRRKVVLFRRPARAFHLS